MPSFANPRHLPEDLGLVDLGPIRVAHARARSDSGRRSLRSERPESPCPRRPRGGAAGVPAGRMLRSEPWGCFIRTDSARSPFSRARWAVSPNSSTSRSRTDWARPAYSAMPIVRWRRFFNRGPRQVALRLGAGAQESEIHEAPQQSMRRPRLQAGVVRDLGQGQAAPRPRDGLENPDVSPQRSVVLLGARVPEPRLGRP